MTPDLPRLVRLRVTACVLFGCGMLATTGCGYQFGSGHPPEVQTVAVPMFRNETFRRGIETHLTEAVQREVKARTPYRLEKEAYAETRIVGTIVAANKHLIGESLQDDPRQLQLSLTVNVVWEDLRTGEVIRSRTFDLPPNFLTLTGNGSLVPEVGQSRATAQTEAVTHVAEQIVDLMESPW